MGERGTTLSGGQQQRLSIARAVYAQPALLILDDPLSAVDPEVCETIFQKAILDYTAHGGSVLMACNQIHLLSRCNQILYLCDGQVAEQGMT